MSPRNGALFFMFFVHACMGISDHASMILYNKMHKKVHFLVCDIMVRVPSGTLEPGQFCVKI